jgi:hypothetical protein
MANVKLLHNSITTEGIAKSFVSVPGVSKDLIIRDYMYFFLNLILFF